MEKVLNLPKSNSFVFLRTLFCLFVIFDHVGIISGAYKTSDLSGISVPVFFILSGFWVTFSYLRSSSVKEYAFKRFRKIFPQYLIVVICCAFGFVFFSKFPAIQYFSDKTFLKYLFANFTTLGFLCNTLPGISLPFGINGALWTIKIEIGFYILLPFIFVIANKVVKVVFGDTNVETGGVLIF